MVLGIGTKSCGAVVKEIDNNVHYNNYFTGYLTAVNSWVGNGINNLREGTDNEGIALWLKNYCTAHPVEDYDEALKQLVFELMDRQQ